MSVSLAWVAVLCRNQKPLIASSCSFAQNLSNLNVYGGVPICSNQVVDVAFLFGHNVWLVA